MAKADFKEEEILTLEDISKGVHLKIDEARDKIESLHLEVDNAFAEVISRFKVEEEYNEARSKIKKPSTRKVLAVLRESGGAHRFTEIRRRVGCSSSTLTGALNELRDMLLVREERNLYQASSPAWFVRKKLELERLKVLKGDFGKSK